MSQSGNTYSPSLCKTFDHIRCHVAERLFLLLSPILLTVGTIGNIVSICVLLQRRMRKNTASTYLVGLAFADTGVLYIGLLREWLVHLAETDYRKENDVTCRLQLWLQFVSFASSVWILTAFTIDRHICVVWPMFSKLRCSRKLQLAVVVTIPLVAMATGTQYLFMEQKITYTWSNVTNTSNIYIVRCEPKTGVHAKFYYKIWPFIVICLCSIIPVLLIFISNLRIIKIMLGRRRRIAPQSIMTNNEQSRVQKSTNNMLIAISIFYIFSTLPICIYLLLESYLFPVPTLENVVNRKLFWTVSSLLFYSNSAVNFILYCFSGSQFRNVLKRMVVSFLQYLLNKIRGDNIVARAHLTTVTNVPGSSEMQPHSQLTLTSGSVKQSYHLDKRAERGVASTSLSPQHNMNSG